MVISIHDHSLYGIACIQCGQTLIAPDCSRYVRSRIVRHAWSCESCGVRFETSDHLRLSEHRRTVRAVTTQNSESRGNPRDFLYRRGHDQILSGPGCSALIPCS